MSILDNTDHRVTEIVYALKCRNDKLGLSAPSYGDVKRAIKLSLDEFKREQDKSRIAAPIEKGKKT